MASTKQVVTSGKVVGIYYTLRDEEDNVLDTNRQGGPPLAFLQGSGNILPGLEKALEGKARNDNIQVELAPEDGYGERSDEAVRDLPRSMFDDGEKVEPGMVVTRQDDQGRKHTAVVTAVNDETITVDSNHPLAGKKLFFDVSIAGVRDATAEEASHGHPHGPGGHKH